MRRFLTGLVLLTLVFGSAISLSAQDTATPTLYITEAWSRPFIAYSEDTTNHEADTHHPENDEHHHANAASEGVLGRGTSAIYFNLTNASEEDVTLTGVNAFVAYRTELHETVIEANDVMMMHPLHDGVVIPAGETVAFAPAGKHVMLINLYRDLYEGQAISLDLTFTTENGETFTRNTAVPVLSVAPIPTLDPAYPDIIVLDAWVRTTEGATESHGHGETATDPHAGHGDAAADSHTNPDDAEDKTETFHGTTAVYMQLLNIGASDTLVEIRTDVAEKVEIHETVIDANDVMRMQALENGLALPNGQTITLAPAGLHIMLIQVREPLVTGQAIALTFVYQSGAEQVIAVPVRDLTGQPWQEDHANGH